MHDAIGAGRVPDRLGPWILGQPLGSGAMGAVFSARHAKSGQQAALKIAVAGTDYGRLLHEEAVALAGCEHRGVIQIHDHGEEQGLVWLALQLVDGETLREWTTRRFGSDDAAPLSKAEVRAVVGWMRDLARALHAMHRRGVLHRDVKPANLMLSRDGEARVIDLGLAIDLGGEAIAALAGTAPYMSPEQVLAAALVDARSDLYSLAVSFHEVLSGWALARGRGSLASVLQDVAFVEAPRLSARVPNALPGLDAVFAKALAKAPADRYRDMAALAEDLDRVLDGQLPKWARETAAVRWRRRVPMVAAIAVVSLVLARFGAGWWADRAAMAEFRALCAAATEAGDADTGRPKRAIAALASALSLRDRLGGDVEFEDVYGSALAVLAPVLTRWTFETAALAPADRIDETETGRVGAMAREHLSALPRLDPATRAELAVQAAFSLLRQGRVAELRQLLVGPASSDRADERLRLLEALGRLVEVEESGADLEARRAALHHAVGICEGLDDFANLPVDMIHCRALLLLEVLPHCEEQVALEVGDSATSDPTATAADAALSRVRAAVERLDPVLAAICARPSLGGRAGNLAAGVLGMVRLALDRPAAAVDVVEARLLAETDRPEAAERAVLALLSAAGRFRTFVEDPTSTVDCVVRAADRFLDCSSIAVGHDGRLLREIRPSLESPDPERRVRAELAAARFLERILEAGPPPSVVGGSLLLLTQCAGFQWDRDGTMDRYAQLGDRLCASGPVRPATGVVEDAGCRLFWHCAILIAGRQEADEGVARVERSRRFLDRAMQMTPPRCLEAEAAAAYVRCRAMPSEDAVHRLRSVCAEYSVRLRELETVGGPIELIELGRAFLLQAQDIPTVEKR